MDAVVHFPPLGLEAYETRFAQVFEEVRSRVLERGGPALRLDGASATPFARFAMEKGEGMRGLLRAAEDLLSAPLEALLASRPDARELLVVWTGERFEFRPT